MYLRVRGRIIFKYQDSELWESQFGGKWCYVLEGFLLCLSVL